MMRKLVFFSLFLIILIIPKIKAQQFVDYSNPKEYIIADITVSGVKYLSKDALIMLSGLKVGQKIRVPGDEISSAIQRLWDQGLFSDVKISITKIEGEKVYLNFFLQEQPRLLNMYISGINKTQEDDLRDLLDLSRGKKVSNSLLIEAEKKIKNYFAQKGYPFVDVSFKMVDDTMYQNVVNLYIRIKKNNRVKIKNIIIRGNQEIPKRKLYAWLKETKRKRIYRFWKPSRYIPDKYKEDKQNIIAHYNKLGYRDARIVEDSVYPINEKYLNVYLKIFEGDKYYFRNISWIGNTKYNTEFLTKKLDIKKGDPYNEERLENRLLNDDDAVANLYLDKGYLFFQAIPREVRVENDSVDVEIMIYEGQQAKINNVIISGNTRTNDHVIRRELRTLPGQLFSKEDLIRSVRELANLGNFDPEQLSPTPIPNQADNTVDIKYNVVEKSSDVFEMSGGWGYLGFVGRLSLRFNNFSARNIKDFSTWAPLPVGDGQKLSISAQANGRTYQLYSFSFVDPWFGGKKPNSFSISIYSNIITNGVTREQADKSPFVYRRTMHMFGAQVGLGRRLSWPDDYFILSNSLSFDYYLIDSLQTYINAPNGSYNIFSLTTTFGRNSVDNPLYSRRGSDLSLTVKLTPPYSLLYKKDYTSMSLAQKMKWVELYKVNIKGRWFFKVIGDFVFTPKFEYGLMGYYNKDIGFVPFEGYTVGGDPMGYYAFGKEFVSLRGYEREALTPSGYSVAHVYSKYSFEMRYPVLLKDMATVYLLSFVEAGNAWYNLYEFNPFKLYRSAGVGVRMFIPMMGLVGIDFAYGLDVPPGSDKISGFHYHFVLGQQF